MDGPLYRECDNRNVTIASGGTTSDPVRNERGAMLGIALPVAFTGTTLTFTVSLAQTGTYQALSDDTGTAVSLAVAQGNSYTLPAALAPWPWFKIVSGSAEGAARSIDVVSKG